MKKCLFPYKIIRNSCCVHFYKKKKFSSRFEKYINQKNEFLWSHSFQVLVIFVRLNISCVIVMLLIYFY